MSYESMSMEISNFCSEIYHGILGWFKKKPDTPLIPQPIDDDEGGGGSSGSSGGGASPSDAQNTIHNRNDELNFMNQNSVNPANNFGRNMRGGGGSGGTTSMVRDGSDFDDGSKFTGKIDANFGFISYNYLVGLANNLTLEKSFFNIRINFENIKAQTDYYCVPATIQAHAKFNNISDVLSQDELFYLDPNPSEVLGMSPKGIEMAFAKQGLKISNLPYLQLTDIVKSLSKNMPPMVVINNMNRQNHMVTIYGVELYLGGYKLLIADPMEQINTITDIKIFRQRLHFIEPINK